MQAFSGYAVRYLKPELTENWRVGKDAHRLGPDGWEGPAAGIRAPQPYGFSFLWPTPVLPQPEPLPGPLWTEAPAFQHAVSDNMQDSFGTPIPEQGKGIVAIGEILNSSRTGACQPVHEAVITPESGISTLREPAFRKVLLCSSAGTRSGALAPTTGREWPRPGRSRPHPLI